MIHQAIQKPDLHTESRGGSRSFCVGSGTFHQSRTRQGNQSQDVVDRIHTRMRLVACPLTNRNIHSKDHVLPSCPPGQGNPRVSQPVIAQARGHGRVDGARERGSYCPDGSARIRTLPRASGPFMAHIGSEYNGLQLPWVDRHLNIMTEHLDALPCSTKLH